MIFQKWLLSRKQKKAFRKNNLVQPLAPEERAQIAMEMNWGYGMLPMGCFPYDVWHFY